MEAYEADTVSVVPMVRGGGELGQEVGLFPFPVYLQRHSKVKTVFKGVSLRVKLATPSAKDIQLF